MAESHSCYHCGLPVPDGADYRVEIAGESRDMCCHGCQAVAQAIVDGALGSAEDEAGMTRDNPATGEPLAEVPSGSEGDVDRAPPGHPVARRPAVARPPGGPGSRRPAGRRATRRRHIRLRPGAPCQIRGPRAFAP